MSMICSSKLVERYQELKAAAPGCLLLIQVGTLMDVHDAFNLVGLLFVAGMA